jgi:hypothetical protein
MLFTTESKLLFIVRFRNPSILGGIAVGCNGVQLPEKTPNKLPGSTLVEETAVPRWMLEEIIAIIAYVRSRKQKLKMKQ